MIHNNWSVFLQTVLACEHAFLGKYLLVFTGESPPLNPDLPPELGQAMVAARGADWLATYTLDGQFLTRIDGKLRQTVESRDGRPVYGSAGTAISDFYYVDFDRNDDVARTSLQADKRTALNTAYANGEAPAPMWYAVVDMTEANSLLAPDYGTVGTLHLMGLIGDGQPPEEGEPEPLVHLRTPDLGGRIPLPYDFGPLALPF